MDNLHSILRTADRHLRRGISKRRPFGHNRFLLGLTFAIVFSVLGYVTLRLSHAATYTPAAEAESGVLASGAAAANDSNASGGAAVQFRGNIHYVALGDSVASGEGI